MQNLAVDFLFPALFSLLCILILYIRRNPINRYGNIARTAMMQEKNMCNSMFDSIIIRIASSVIKSTYMESQTGFCERGCAGRLRS